MIMIMDNNIIDEWSNDHSLSMDNNDDWMNESNLFLFVSHPFLSWIVCISTSVNNNNNNNDH